MTEKKLSEQGKSAARLHWGWLAGGGVFAVVAGLVLFRQPIAESLGQQFCEQQKLSCDLNITRLDFGGVTLSGFDVRKPDARNAALSAGKLAVNFTWSGPFNVRPAAIEGDGLVVRLDFSGLGPMLGDLDPIASSFQTGGGGGTMPRIDIQNLRVIADTVLGPVEAHGFVTAESMADLRMELKAQSANLALAGARIDLETAEINAAAKDGVIDAHAKIDLTTFQGAGVRISDLTLDLAVEQSAAGLNGRGGMNLREAVLRDETLNGVSAEASLNAAPLDFNTITPEAIVAALQSVSIKANAGEGAMSGLAWGSIDLTADVKRGERGNITLAAENVKHDSATARRVEVKGELVLGTASAFTANGQAAIDGAALPEEMRAGIARAIRTAADGVLPKFAPAAGNAFQSAAGNFDVLAPWSAKGNGSAISVALESGARINAASGLVLALTREDQQGPVLIAGEGEEDWRAAGILHLSGGGAPSLTMTLNEAVKVGPVLRAAGAVDMPSWRVGEEALSLKLSDLAYSSDTGKGAASGDISIGISGDVAGGVWKNARATGVVSAAWNDGGFVADAPRGLTLSWNEGRYGGTVLGAGALRYAPAGNLAKTVGDGMGGAGALRPAGFPVTGESFSARANIGGANVNWTLTGDAFRANFDANPMQFDLIQSDGVVPVRIADVKGQVTAGDGWRVTGNLSGGSARAYDVSMDNLAARLDLTGRGGGMNGRLTDVTFDVLDNLDEAGRRFEAAKFEGNATLDKSVATFTGVFSLAQSGIQLANFTGQHDLGSARGELVFAPTPLIFEPRSFQPSALSPLLRGPANVTGRVDVAGGATWSPGDFNATAQLQLRRVGFALANAGVFQGVSGTVAVSDLFKMQSAPGQTLTIESVTLGTPFEQGVVKFQLAGFDGVRLESAVWPFAGGEIRLTPLEYMFDAGQNRLVAEAVDWDLPTLIERFKVPDVKVQGKVNGTFPIVFSTGSARIDNAVLEATKEGGVIQYSGSTGDAAGQSDQSAKLLFDALSDFRYQVLRMELDGDLAGQMIMKLTLRGANPNVLSGQPFDVNVSIDSPLLSLLNMTSRTNDQVDAVVNAVIGSRD